MIVKCPHCGLEGKAEEEILKRKIRCPQCKKIFLVVNTAAEAVAEIVPTETSGKSPGPEETCAKRNDTGEACCGIELGENVLDTDIASFDDEVGPVVDELPEGVFRCVCCGFVFSEQYKQDSELGACCVSCNLAGKS